MKGVFTLYTQLPKPKEVGKGTVDIDKHGTALFVSGLKGDVILARMERVKIDIAGVDGLRLSGFESVGFDKQRREKFCYQEWWLAYEQAIN